MCHINIEENNEPKKENHIGCGIILVIFNTFSSIWQLYKSRVFKDSYPLVYVLTFSFFIINPIYVSIFWLSVISKSA